MKKPRDLTRAHLRTDEGPSPEDVAPTGGRLRDSLRSLDGYEAQMQALRPVQMKRGPQADGRGPSAGPAATGPRAVHVVAKDGVAGGGSPLPYLSTIQASFGKHDVSGVRAHTGASASAATEALGARAYAYDNDVAFGANPDLHTAAHEATHVLQQRKGVQLAGGVGKTGDVYEEQADAVADLVVAGKSAEGVLDAMVGGVGGGGGGGAVQAGLWDDATSWVGDKVDDATDWASDKAEGAKDWASDKAGGAKDWASEKLDQARDWAGGMSDWAGVATGGTGGGAWDDFKADVSDLLENGFSNPFAERKHAEKGITDPLKPKPPAHVDLSGLSFSQASHYLSTYNLTFEQQDLCLDAMRSSNHQLAVKVLITIDDAITTYELGHDGHTTSVTDSWREEFRDPTSDISLRTSSPLPGARYQRHQEHLAIRGELERLNAKSQELSGIADRDGAEVAAAKVAAQPIIGRLAAVDSKIYKVAADTNQHWKDYGVKSAAPGRVQECIAECTGIKASIHANKALVQYRQVIGLQAKVTETRQNAGTLRYFSSPEVVKLAVKLHRILDGMWSA